MCVSVRPQFSLPSIATVMHVSVICMCFCFVCQTCLVMQNVRQGFSEIVDTLVFAFYRIAPYVTGIGCAQLLASWLPQDVMGMISSLVSSLVPGTTLQDEPDEMDWDPVSPNPPPYSPSSVVGLPLLLYLFRVLRRNRP